MKNSKNCFGLGTPTLPKSEASVVHRVAYKNGYSGLRNSSHKKVITKVYNFTMYV